MHSVTMKIIARKLTRMVKATMEDTLSYVRLQAFLSGPLDIMNGLRKTVSLGFIFLYIVLQKVITDSHIQIGGQNFTWSIQLIGHAANVSYTTRTRIELVEGFCSLGIAAKGTGLRINQTTRNIWGPGVA